jgi:hypothetical protein
MTLTSGTPASTHLHRPQTGTPPQAAGEHSPDGWEANHAVPAHLAEHRVRWRP